ncbi:MAG: hypothetical protein PHI05_03780 [Bacilli bacterium]|nr:hypothetical protein [Bacilli bacterium]MDD4547840.1 hypothetical protein [Bacilli bacterium]
MDRLNEILYELGITKVKLAKILGVSRQMIYNYLELEDLNKWPKDKKVLILNLLNIKSPDELDDIKVDTDYIMGVEERIDTLFTDNSKTTQLPNDATLFTGIGKKQKEVMSNIIEFMREKFDDNNDLNTYNSFLYFYHFLQTMQTSPELKYLLAYVSKAAGFTKPKEFVFDEDEQFIFESIMFSAMTLYKSGGTSKSKLAESHRRFVNQIEQKREEKMSRTLELNSAKIQALRELGYNEITEKNAAEVFEKMAEIQSRKVTA